MSPVPAELRLDGVSWSAGRTPIVTGVDLTVPSGTVTGLIGPNGSGKSTLLAVAAGIRAPDSGAVHLGDQDVHALGARERARRIALLEQQADTELDLRVEDVVALGRTPYRGRWAPADPSDAAAVTAAMDRTGVTGLRGRSWATLSGGERQRTHLARALAQRPEALLLDEPTNHLDLGHQIRLLCLVRDLGLTTLAALHDLELAAAFCGHLAVLEHGRLVAHGTPAEVLTPRLIASVFGVTAEVTAHPTAARPHIVWNENEEAPPA